MKLTKKRFLIVLAIFAVPMFAEWAMGRLWLGPDGKFGFYSWNIWSAEQSQRVLDPYSFSHFIHGLIFFAFLWPFRNRIPLASRFLMALAFEGAWEILENSPLIIERYRAMTVSYGYTGDSILNSMFDIVLAGLGFWFAHKNKFWISIGIAILFELITLWWVRDNLTLNIIMLTYPLESIRKWQQAIAPH